MVPTVVKRKSQISLKKKKKSLFYTVLRLGHTSASKARHVLNDEEFSNFIFSLWENGRMRRSEKSSWSGVIYMYFKVTVEIGLSQGSSSLWHNWGYLLLFSFCHW